MIQFLALLLCLGSIANAGYDKTSWGMAYKKVVSLYPGGRKLPEQNGEKIYGVVRPVAGLTTAYINFHFDVGAKLRSVNVVFPEQGSNVNLTDGTFTQTSKATAKTIYQNIFAALTRKYGRTQRRSSATNKIWNPEKGEFVTLGIAKGTDPAFAAVTINYGKIPTLAKSVEGL